MAALTTTYGTRTTITVAPENVATSSTFIAGVESAVQDNTSDLAVDALVSGQWTAGTTPTTDTRVLVYVGALQDDTVYPDVFDGTSSAETLTSVGVGLGFLKLGAILTVDSTTSNRVYSCGPFSVAALFGGVMPPKWFLFITHNTGVNSNTTAGNHVWKYLPIKYAIA